MHTCVRVRERQRSSLRYSNIGKRIKLLGLWSGEGLINNGSQLTGNLRLTFCHVQAPARVIRSDLLVIYLSFFSSSSAIILSGTPFSVLLFLVFFFKALEECNLRRFFYFRSRSSFCLSQVQHYVGIFGHIKILFDALQLC